MGDEKMNDEWEKEREKAIKTGCIRPIETDKIRLAISKKEIEDIIKKIGGVEIDLIIDELKMGVYLRKYDNRKAILKNKVYYYCGEHRRSFPKLFWEEYVYQYDARDNYRDKETYNHIKKNAKEMEKIKDMLDKNPSMHGMTGNHAVMFPNFSWRGWGALMAAYMNSKKGKRLYHYMDFYM